jgi:AraC family transcriptional regulator
MKLGTAAGYHERILRALVHIQSHLDDALSLDELASVACFSPFHFRVFRALTGEGVHEHVRRLKLERAAQRLKLQEQPVTDLAFEAGYESHEAFTRAFHTMFGMSPSDFRNSRQPAPEPSGFQPPDYGAPAPIEIKTLAPQLIVFLRHVGPYDQVGATWGRLAMWAGMRGLIGPASRFLGVSWDDPEITPPEKLRYDAAITLSRPIPPEGEFGVTELAGGEYATLLHKGPYEGLSASYRAIFGGWLPASGRELRDAPCFEHYLNSPQNARPEELLTVIHVPV